MNTTHFTQLNKEDQAIALKIANILKGVPHSYVHGPLGVAVQILECTKAQMAK